jgi:hypothetical protein
MITSAASALTGKNSKQVAAKSAIPRFNITHTYPIFYYIYATGTGFMRSLQEGAQNKD